MSDTNFGQPVPGRFSPTVIVRYDERGEMEFYVCGDVRLIMVDERCQSDRVYEMLNRCEPEQISEILGDDPIGNKNDDRHPAIEAKILAALDGKPHLSVVE